MQILQQLATALLAWPDNVHVTTPEILNTPAASWGPPVNFSRPPAIVLWHGLGDNYNSSGMRHVTSVINQLVPEVFIHSVYIDSDPSTDERRSIFGDANSEVDIVCEQLSGMPELAGGFGAIGFSQGGLFLRALIERCANISVSTLVTFGSPHMGVLELPMCAREDDWVCKRRNAVLKKQVWNRAVQKSVVPAQYFRDLDQYSSYLEHLSFLADVNNERDSSFLEEAKKRFENLEKLVLIQFDQDTTLVPKQSAHFGEVTDSGTVGYEHTRLYKQDLIGLRKLHQEKKVDFYNVNDDHMRFPDVFLTDIVSRYFGDGL